MISNSRGGRGRWRPCRLAIVFTVGLFPLLSGCSIPRWPVDGTLTSPFGLRFRGIRPDLHEGVDIYAPAGTPVLAMKHGRVVHAGVLGGYGNAVMIDHGGGVITVYAHLSEVRVRNGQQVRDREVIGTVGSTGNATGPHLHFEVWRGGRAEDPVPLLGGWPPP